MNAKQRRKERRSRRCNGTFSSLFREMTPLERLVVKTSFFLTPREKPWTALSNPFAEA